MSEAKVVKETFKISELDLLLQLSKGALDSGSPIKKPLLNFYNDLKKVHTDLMDKRDAICEEYLVTDRNGQFIKKNKVKEPKSLNDYKMKDDSLSEEFNEKITSILNDEFELEIIQDDVEREVLVGTTTGLASYTLGDYLEYMVEIPPMITDFLYAHFLKHVNTYDTVQEPIAEAEG